MTERSSETGASAATPDHVVRALLPLVRRFWVGPYGVALGGSHAKGAGDAWSDVDIYLFADRVLPGRERDALVIEALGEEAAPATWGGDEDFVQGGTDFDFRRRKVEVWLRSARHVEDSVAAALRGEVRRDFAAWTVMGFFGHVVLADVHAMRIVEDSHGMLARWKSSVAEYPEALRAALLGRFLPEARFWPDNFHYRTAVERADAIYTSGIVQMVAHALIQAAFALNRRFFPGEKKLAGALADLPIQPPDFASRIESLLHPAAPPTVQNLQAQRRDLAALVAEVDALARSSERG